MTPLLNGSVYTLVMTTHYTVQYIFIQWVACRLPWKHNSLSNMQHQLCRCLMLQWHWSPRKL